MNEEVVQNLSFRMHTDRGIPYWYAVRYMWMVLLAKCPHNISLQMGSETVVPPLPTDYIGSTTLMDTILNICLQSENRLAALPLPPDFDDYKILTLQNYVQMVLYMCMQLPGDIARKVQKQGIYAEYTVLADLYIQWELDTHDSVVACEAAEHFVEKAMQCGGVEIDIYSAFWVLNNIPLVYKLWELSYLHRLPEKLLLFPEIDQDIVVKVQKMMAHPEWKKHTQMVQRPLIFTRAQKKRLSAMVERLRADDTVPNGDI